MHNISDKCDFQIVDPIAILYGITEYIKNCILVIWED
jgi:hypothetical protein